MDEYIRQKLEEERLVEELTNQIGYNRKRFVSKFHENPEAVFISMEDYPNLVRYYSQMRVPLTEGNVGELKMFGMKILRSPDLESGEFYLSPHHLL